MLKKIGFIGLVLILASCSTMDKKDCIEADWHSLGFQDGKVGRPLSYMDSRAKDCAEHGVKIKSHIYKRGRIEGLLRFCTEENAYRDGLRGNVNLQVCGPKEQGRFDKAYNYGFAIYKTKKERKALLEEIQALDEKINKANRMRLEVTEANEANLEAQQDYDKLIRQRKLKEREYDRLGRKLNLLETGKYLKDILGR